MVQIKRFFKFTETAYNPIYKCVENVATWELEERPESMIFTRTDAHTGRKETREIRVAENPDYSYRLLKTCIQAKDGSHGLYNFFVWAIEKHVAECLAVQICNHALTICKPYKAKTA